MKKYFQVANQNPQKTLYFTDTFYFVHQNLLQLILLVHTLKVIMSSARTTQVNNFLI